MRKVGGFAFTPTADGFVWQIVAERRLSLAWPFKAGIVGSSCIARVA